jgi:5-formyltetrahydrofolate cyclo-ligase
MCATPSNPEDEGSRTAKEDIRRLARERRRDQANKDALSRRILSRVLSLGEYRAANTVLFYVDVRDEVRTRGHLPDILLSEKRVLVPFCDGADLRLFRLTRMDELSPGNFGILEPKPGLRNLAARVSTILEVDLALVPGLAFDRTGGRLGHGQGYYDCLLRGARPGACLVGLAFECQLFASIPRNEHDVSVDKVITEVGVYDCLRSTRIR